MFNDDLTSNLACNNVIQCMNVKFDATHVGNIFMAKMFFKTHLVCGKNNPDFFPFTIKGYSN